MRVVISDHAIVRYLERVPGPHPMNENGTIDMDKVRWNILADGRRDAFAAGAKSVKIAGIVFRGDREREDSGVIIVRTVVPSSSNRSKRHPHPSNGGRKPKDGRARRLQGKP